MSLAEALVSVRLQQALKDRQPVKTLCAHCDWWIEGPLADTRIAYRAHRLAEHPEVVPSMPNVRARAMRPSELKQLSVALWGAAA